MKEEKGTKSNMLGTWLREARENKNLTQAELAAQVGAARTTFENFELGRYRPRVALGAAIARALDLSVGGMLALAGRLEVDLRERVIVQPTEQILEHIFPYGPWQSRLAGSYLRWARAARGRSAQECALEYATLTGTGEMDGDAEGAAWERAESGYVKRPGGAIVPLAQAPGRIIWALAQAARADADILLFLAGRWRAATAKKAGVDLSPYYAAQKAAGLQQDPWLNLEEFVRILRTLRGDESAKSSGPAIRQLPDGRWRIEADLPATLSGADIGRLAETLSEMARCSPGPGN